MLMSVKCVTEKGPFKKQKSTCITEHFVYRWQSSEVEQKYYCNTFGMLERYIYQNNIPLIARNGKIGGKESLSVSVWVGWLLFML